MGYNIGLRLIEDFLAKSNAGRCANFRETADMISKVRATFCQIVLKRGFDKEITSPEGTCKWRCLCRRSHSYIWERISRWLYS